MRGKKAWRLITTLVPLLVGFVFVFHEIAMTAAAAGEDTVVVVSMGDSYSAGEGLGLGTKLENGGKGSFIGYPDKTEDWYAHRSTVSWPSRLQIPGVDGTLSKYYVKLDETSTAPVQWYFIASSGAETVHFQNKQPKPDEENCEFELRPQEQIFNGIEGNVDYVTMTIGGNDVGFAKILTNAVIETWPILGDYDPVQQMLDDTWANLETYKSRIKQTYVNVSKLAGDGATILVAGYPILLTKSGGWPIKEKLATAINEKTNLFDDEIRNMVLDCRTKNGIDIHFVDVRDAFAGHAAFDKDPYLNEIKLHQKDDLPGLISAYSFHPNDKGAQAYADCVNFAIQEITKAGSLSFKVCMASKPKKTIEAQVAIYQEDQLIVSSSTDEKGEFTMSLPAGEYRVEVTADGYLKATAEAKIKQGMTTFLDDFKLVKASETMTGTIRNVATGKGEKDVKLTIREGKDNETGDVLAEVMTAENGMYSVMLAAGDYTVFMEKEGFIPESFNASIKKKQKDPVDAKIRPLSLGDEYTIVLTWGQNPSDLDAHLEGERSDGSKFHASHNDKNVMDGDKVICTLDEDDMMRSGPEYVTLNATTKKPYYYYVNRYRGEGKLKDSNAQVTVYQGEKLIETFDVPTDKREGDYWNVFAIVNGKIKIQNTITEDPDLNYADK